MTSTLHMLQKLYFYIFAYFSILTMFQRIRMSRISRFACSQFFFSMWSTLLFFQRPFMSSVHLHMKDPLCYFRSNQTKILLWWSDESSKMQLAAQCYIQMLLRNHFFVQEITKPSARFFKSMSFKIHFEQVHLRYTSFQIGTSQYSSRKCNMTNVRCMPYRSFYHRCT